MKAKVVFGENLENEIELDNCCVQQFRQIGERPIVGNPMMTEKYGQGDPITIVCNNMPDSIKEEISAIISRHCNH